MRKGALLLSLVIVASAPTAVLAAPKAPADPNAPGKKFFYELAMQPYYAWQSVWVVKPAKK